jgi:hypothetical protein
MNRRKWLIASLVSVSTISAVFEGLYYRHGIPSTPATSALAVVLSAFLLACGSTPIAKVIRKWSDLSTTATSS